MAQSWRAEEGIAGNGLNTAPHTDDDLLFLAEQGSIRTYMLAGATHLRVDEGKKVRISGTLKSPHVIMV
jgi:hypothetical protein